MILLSQQQLSGIGPVLAQPLDQRIELAIFHRILDPTEKKVVFWRKKKINSLPLRKQWLMPGAKS